MRQIQFSVHTCAQGSCFVDDHHYVSQQFSYGVGLLSHRDCVSDCAIDCGTKSASVRAHASGHAHLQVSEIDHALASVSDDEEIETVAWGRASVDVA